tara:strand:- start:695 stop:1348 length:654 start_codon:yes stop_codon:yes gene_type:complete
MANYWEYNGTIHIKESPLRGLTGMGGGAVMSSQSSSGNTWTHNSSYSGFTTGVRIDGGSVIDEDWAENMQELTFQWEVYVNSGASSNSWHIQVTPGWDTDAGGLLIGIQGTWKVSIAGPQLGGYGYTSTNDLPGQTWTECRYCFMASALHAGNNAKQRVYYGDTSQGEQTTHNQSYITFDTGIWGGAGRQSPNTSFTTAFSGSIRNLKLTDTYAATF